MLVLVQAPNLFAVDWGEMFKDRHRSWLMLCIVLNSVSHLRPTELESEDVLLLHKPLKTTGIEDSFQCTFSQTLSRSYQKKFFEYFVFDISHLGTIFEDVH